MRWGWVTGVAVGGTLLVLAIPYPDVRTALLLLALLGTSVLVPRVRAATTVDRLLILALALGVLLHSITTAAHHSGRIAGVVLDDPALSTVHATSYLASVVLLLVVGYRALRAPDERPEQVSSAAPPVPVPAAPPAHPGAGAAVGGHRRAVPSQASPPHRPAAASDLDDALRHAVADRALSVHYQPIVDSRSGEVGSVEALVRWDHPTLGLLAPGHFLPAAERMGLMVEIGRHVLDVACADLAGWRERWPRLALAVNMSERELLHPGFAHHVLATLRRHDLPASALHLELTETVAVNEDTIADVLEPLAAAGVALSIDDFGTGHSSLHRLNRLRSLQVQRLKIDKSFLDEMDGSGQGAGPLLASMISLAHSVGHWVVAEGVESGEQAAFLAEHGCDELQGYLYSRPVPAGQVVELLPRLAGNASLAV